MSGNINFNGWINDDGSENYKCRAWVNFNGTGTVAIRASGNVSSITDNGAGDYTVNFTQAMTDADYSTVASCGRNTTSGGSSTAAFLVEVNQTLAPTTTSVQMSGYNYNLSKADSRIINVAIFR